MITHVTIQYNTIQYNNLYLFSPLIFSCENKLTLFNQSVIIEHFQKQGNPSQFNSNFKKEIENQLKNMEEDMMYKAESDSTITNKEIKKAIFDLKKGKSAGPDRILNEVIKYTNLYFIMILLSIYIYNWIGNKFLQLTSPSPYKYINSINKTNQMTANVQAISIIISKLSKSMSN